ncbi:ABC transporter substrate-binding protein [Agromyces sp. SYSU T00194]|uniref:ABC transporter substrate-binding protein n=1 Tax=Agromyces chitinivorans TaxID=3158560 RepID=UPI00339AFC48
MFSIRKRRGVLAAAAMTAAAGLALTGCSSDDGAGEFDPNEEVTLDFAFWGNDVRADLYDQVLTAFEEEYPNITVNSTFLGFPEFWEKRQTEAAGGGLPDVMQFDYSYLRQYSENGLLLDLDPYLGDLIETEPLSDNILSIGVVGGTTYGIPTSTNAWGMYTNPVLLEQAGVDEFAGGSWADYNDWMAEVTDASGGAVYGGTDWTGRIQNFEVQLRSEGSYVFSDEGEPGFDEARLAEFWESGADIRDSGAVISQQELEEIYPVSGFDSAKTASELTWDNFGAGYLGNLGEDYTELGLIAPPVTVEGAQDLYLKPSMLHTIAANTEHPEASATLVNFLINSPQSGEIFGTNRGLPASTTALEAAQLDDLSQQIADYEASIADRLGDAPPVPIVGYGTLEEKFRQIGTELGFGTLTVDEAVSQFFAEMDVVLNQ